MENKEKIENILSELSLGIPVNISRLGGLTNRNYRVITDKDDYVVRLPGKGTDKIINRTDEEKIIKAIDHLGIDAPLIAFNAQDGLKICRHISDALTLNASLLHELNTMEMVAMMLRKLHDNAHAVDIVFDVIAMVTKYEDALVALKGYMPQDYWDIRDEIFNLKRKHENSEEVLVLSHNDPLPENFIMGSEEQLFLVDWEYGGMNSAYWDVADVSVESGFDVNQDTFLLKAYLMREPCNEDWRQFTLNKLYIDLLWCLWGFVREAFNDPSEHEDFIAYGNMRFERLKNNLKEFYIRYD